MKNLLLISLLAAISLFSACGSSGGSTPVGTGGGSFSNASLKGQYAYQITGTDLANGVPYREAGYFVADGNGHLTSGADDFSETSTSGGVQSNPISGTYSVANDGTGSLILNNTFVGNLSFSLTLVSTTEALINEADAGAIAAGRADLQNPSSLTATPAGTFAFRLHTISSVNGSASLAGAMKVSGGTITGSDDVLRGSAFDNGTGASLSITGTFGAPSNGRGAGSVTDASGTANFIYYVLDSNHLDLLASDTGVVGVGTAEMQSGAPFSNSSLNGSYVFGSRADDSSSLGAQNTVGVFTAGGNGTISTGMLDSVQDGNSLSQVSLSGSYTGSSNGRVAVTLTPSGSNGIKQVFWMVSPARAYLLTDDTTKVEDGTLDQQQGSSFSASSLNGQYAFAMDGLEFTNAGTVYLTRVGWIIWNGSGKLTWNEAVNNSALGFNTPGNLSGTYAVASNGRAVVTVNNLSINSNDIVVYLVSGSKGYMLQNDTGVEIVGSMTQQP